MMNFFNWNAGGSSSSRAAPSTSYARHTSDNASEVQKKLSELCQGLQAPLLKPLGSLLSQLAQALHRLTLPDAIIEDVKQAIDFLKGGMGSSKYVDFMLLAHSDQEAVMRRLEGLQAALTLACQSGGERAEGLEELRRAEQEWQSAVDTFMANAGEVSELHFYLVFLDIKGDRALLDVLCRRLGRLLQLPTRSMTSCLAKTRPWAENALKVLACREALPLLERLHTESLNQWRACWQEKVQQGQRPAEEKLGVKFWDSNFVHLFKIAWPDFVEAFENFYLLGRCPTDLVRRLRLRVDPSCSHQVTRHAWQSLLQGHSRITDVVDMLLQEVLSDPAPCIYRSRPLPHHRSADEGQLSTEQHDGAAGQAGEPDARSHLRPPVPLPPASQALPPKPKPWFPFAHSASDDADMAIPTPHDSHHQTSSRDKQAGVAWDDFVLELCSQHSPWWSSSDEKVEPPSARSPGPSADESLRAAALQAVDTCIACTHRALIFRIYSGDLAQNKPVLQLPTDGDVPEEKSEVQYASPRQDEQATTDFSSLPALVVNANGTRFSGVTKFGRSSSRKTLIPDCPMSEPIASRSHFNVVYEQEADRYYLMDAGSKWGTFVKIGSSVTLSCGDWIRVGGVEFIIRFCGGGCQCLKNHEHYRLHSLRVHCDQQDKHGAGRSARGSYSPAASGSFRRPLTCDRSQGEQGLDGDSSDEEPAAQLQNELLMLLGSRQSRGWMTSSARLCQQRARFHCEGTSQHQGEPTASTSSWPGRYVVPITPLELDFISGPRMGEKLVLCERVCTLGRGEGNTIQVTDSQLASVSRVHCIFEFIGNRWHMRDNGSTNGTWRRLSCVLEPSKLLPVTGVMSVQAGTHEFIVKEAEMRQRFIPSPAVAALEDLCKEEVRLAASSADD
eukprot:TRINITY_DN52438_c0_g1_i1.p1 TRINITY_DN52438_c0_g1~~TRINITY_DN52438_c0_g1_i1.p1  ORF type:complete len:897 (+),score=171.46 TRINITY_DN52438_c0_g1_i1:79-2769(+)